MFNDVFMKVLEYKSSASIVTTNNSDFHIAGTWNTYINIMGNDTLLIPVAGMKTLQEDVKINNKVKMLIGRPDIQGLFVLGAGFSIEGVASFIESGEYFDMMKEKFPFLIKVLAIKATSVKQVL